MPQTYHKVQRARRVNDNEFYSTEEFVTDFMEKIFADPKCKDIFRGKIVCCPCDTEKSEFVKFFQKHQESLGIKEVWYFVDYFNPKVLEADYIITNPPFHQVNKWLKWLSDNGKKWAVVKGFINCYYNRKCNRILDPPETSYYDAGDWQFDRPDGTKKGVGVLYSSNFADYTYSRAPKELFYSDYKHPTYTNNKIITDAPLYYIENCSKNGVPKDAKYIALSARFEVNKIKGWKKCYTTNGYFGTVNGKAPFTRVIWEKENYGKEEN